MPRSVSGGGSCWSPVENRQRIGKSERDIPPRCRGEDTFFGVLEHVLVVTVVDVVIAVDVISFHLFTIYIPMVPTDFQRNVRVTLPLQSIHNVIPTQWWVGGGGVLCCAWP